MSKSTRGQISLRRIFSIFGAVVMPLAQLGFAEGTQRLVKDINPTLRSAAGSFPSELVTSADGKEPAADRSVGFMSFTSLCVPSANPSCASGMTTAPKIEKILLREI